MSARRFLPGLAAAITAVGVVAVAGVIAAASIVVTAGIAAATAAVTAGAAVITTAAADTVNRLTTEHHVIMPEQAEAFTPAIIQSPV